MFWFGIVIFLTSTHSIKNELEFKLRNKLLFNEDPAKSYDINHRKNFYSPDIAPYKTNGLPVDIYLKFHLIFIPGIDEIGSTFQVQFQLEQKWYRNFYSFYHFL